MTALPLFQTRRWLRIAVPVVALGLLGAASVRADDPAPPPGPGGMPPVAKPADGEKAADGEKKDEPKVAPDFTLKDLDGKERKLSEFKDKWVVLEWTNYTCPFVKKHYNGGNMQALQKKYTDKGVVWLTICSSASRRRSARPGGPTGPPARR